MWSILKFIVKQMNDTHNFIYFLVSERVVIKEKNIFETKLSEVYTKNWFKLD